MVDRLLNKLEPQRRHLASLVGLLVLTFVLTGVLAFQAYRAQAARARENVQVAEAGVERIQAELLRNMKNSSGALFYGVNNARLVVEPDAPLESLINLETIAQLCRDCGGDFTFTSAFSYYPATGAFETIGNSLSADHIGRLLRHQAGGHWMGAYGPVSGGVYFVNDAGTPRVAVLLTLVSPDSVPLRVVGYTLDRESALLMIAFAMNRTVGFRGTVVDTIPNNRLFSIRALATQAPLLDTPSALEFAPPVTSSEAPMFGLTVQLALNQDARAKLIPAGDASAFSPFLLALVTLIGAVIALALLLVRREAELVRLRAEFISGVSHELRTPLAQIRMFTETLLLGRTRSDIERRRSLEIIDQEARRLTHLVENVLLFSRGEGGRRPGIAPEPTPFAGEIRRAIEGFGPMCRTRNADIRAELQENITASVDRNALRQILINLLENALKYGPDGQRITVGLALFDDMARVWVDDEGPGIPAGDRERVFDSFVRLRRDLESRVAGSGIGLSVVRELARLHKGDVRAESAPGGGARIVVEFPDAYLRSETPAEIPAAS